MSTSTATEPQRDGSDVVLATQGFGPLLERDYWAEIVGTEMTPEQVGTMVRRRFEDFAPPETAAFYRESGEGKRLQEGDDLKIRIALLGGCRVRVVHADDCGLTLRTLKGHPEAGRITFVAHRDDEGRLVFRIRSRTRANGLVNFVGYTVLGKQLQARCWINFVGKVVEATGGRPVPCVHVRTYTVAEGPGDRGGGEPTYRCGPDGAAAPAGGGS